MRASFFYRVSQLVAPLSALVRRLWGLPVARVLDELLARALSGYPPHVLLRFSQDLGFSNQWRFREALRHQLEVGGHWTHTDPRALG